MARLNYYKQDYQKKDGTKATKTLTSTTKSNTQLRSEAQAWCKSKGYKATSASSGTKPV